MPWDDNAYAFLVDVMLDTATTVCFPTSAFHPTPYTIVCTEEDIVNNIQNLNMDVFPPIPSNANANANAAGGLVLMQYVMYLPSLYVTYFWTPVVTPSR